MKWPNVFALRLEPRSEKILLGVLFFVALLPRLAAIGRYITPDELIWVHRSIQFRQALLNGQWSDTLTAEHPGVITTWLGTLGISLQLWLRPTDLTAYQWVTQLAWFAPENIPALSKLAQFLTAGRLAVIVVNSLGLVIIFRLAQKLAGFPVALLVAFGLALDPFVAGLSGLLHVDALMMTFATISLLALALPVTDATLSDKHMTGYTAVSGITAALALLTKSPAILLPPLAAFGLMILWWRKHDMSLRRRFSFIGWKGAIWLSAYVLTIALLFPAMWSSPGAVWAKMSQEGSRHVQQVLRPTFFLGEVTFDPGPLFYPVAVAFRLSPIIFLGIILTISLIIKHRFRWQSLLTLLFGVWPLLFVLGISLAVKKFDRYALPIIPALYLLASLAWVHIIGARRRWRQWGVPVLLGVQVVYLLLFVAYPQTAVNSLLGGPRVARNILPVNWGEPVSAAGRWLALQPGAGQKTAVTGMAPALAPFFPGQTLIRDDETLPQADYVVVPIGNAAAEVSSLAPEAALLHTVRFNGLAQANIYEQPRPQKPEVLLESLPAPVSFGDYVQLLARGVSVQAGRVDYTIRWRLARPTNGRYTVKLTLRDEANQIWVSRETALLNDVFFYPEHWREGETPEIRYTIPLPPAIPPAPYTLELVLIDDATGAQLPLRAADGALRGVVFTEPDIVVPAADIIPPSRLDIPVATSANWLNGDLTLLGHSVLPETAVSGARATLDLFWQAHTDVLPANLMLTWRLGQTQSVEPLSRYDSGRWRRGELVHEKYWLAIPSDLEAGFYDIQLWPATNTGTPVPGTAVTLGTIEIIPPDGLFELPPDIAIPLHYRFDDRVQLHGLDWASAGETIDLTLYWQVDGPTTELVSTFVHLVGPDDDTVAQADRWPGGLPSVTWVPGQVIIDQYQITLPADVPAGFYQVAVGLYTPVDARRLTAVDANGIPQPDNRIILPVSLEVVPENE